MIQEQGTPVSLTVPYILGDENGFLQAQLMEQLEATGRFHCVQNGGTYLLQVNWIEDDQDRIGFRYDRDNPSGKREKNLLGVESRHRAKLEVSLLDANTQACVLGPFVVCSHVDFDYTDPGSPRDLLFADRMPVIQFSLGQLDSSEGAFDDSLSLLTQKLSKEIALVLQESLN